MWNSSNCKTRIWVLPALTIFIVLWSLLNKTCILKKFWFALLFNQSYNFLVFIVLSILIVHLLKRFSKKYFFKKVFFREMLLILLMFLQYLIVKVRSASLRLEQPFHMDLLRVLGKERWLIWTSFSLVRWSNFFQT
jgi:hypothetical protein